MASVLTQLPLPMLPRAAVQIAPGVGLVTGAGGGGAVWVHGLATFAWDTGDEAGRRLAAVQLIRLGAASQAAVAAAFGVDPGTVWRWDQALDAGGVAGLVPARTGPRGPSKLTAEVAAAIRELDAAGHSLAEIARTTGVSVFSVRNALGRIPAWPAAASGAGGDGEAGSGETEVTGRDAGEQTTAEEAAGAGAEPAAGEEPAELGAGAEAGPLPVLPGPVPRSGERALARWGLLGEAAPVFAPGARYPLAGLLLALPALEATGLLACARAVYGRLRNGFYGLNATLLMLVFLALLRDPRAEGATRIPPPALGRLLGLDRAPEVKTIRRKLGELAAAGRATELVLALARHHAATRAEAIGFLYVDGHTRVYCGTRKVQKTHVARLKFPAAATEETWVTDGNGDPVFVVMAEPSASLAGELRRLLPQLRQIAGEGRRVTVGFDRGGWSPELFADIIDAGFDILTYRKGRVPGLPAEAFAATGHVDEHGRSYEYDLADTTAALAITTGRRKGQVLTLRQVTRRDRDGHQVHVLTSRAQLASAEVAYRMSGRWREENYFRYARAHFDLDALDSYAAAPDHPGRLVPNRAKKAAAAKARKAGAAAAAAEQDRDAALLRLRAPGPGTTLITNQVLNDLQAPVDAARAKADAARAAAAATPARIRLGDIAPDTVVLDTEVKQITHAIRMAAYNTETALTRILHGHYARADDEAYALIREALTGSGDIQPSGRILHVRLDPLTAPRRTRALAALCDQLNATATRYPGTSLELRYQVKPHPDTA